MNQSNAASALSHLVCPECQRQFEADRLQTYCRDCQSPLLAVYDIQKLRQELTPGIVKGRQQGLWRWAELLPVRDPSNRLTLGEGDTPLLQAPRLAESLGLQKLFIKDEGINPTGTFKARGLAVAVARAMELGVRAFVIPTAGNAGGALASYAARGRCEAHVFMPQDAPTVNVEEVRAAGAELYLVHGLISDAAQAAAAAAKTAMEQGQDPWFDFSTFREPYRVEGKKTMGLELAEAFGWRLPHVIIYPTGGGTGLVGMWKAFDELEALGWIGPERPRMVSVQAAGCAPVVRAFETQAERIEPWENASTVAAGLRVPAVFADRLVLRVLHESQGNAVSVSDEEILKSQSQLARMEGIFAAPEGAATLAGLQKLIRQGWIKPDENVVLFNTGSGLKYIDHDATK
ncbi:MAG TPA: threonine synthase [Anaerolineales bacterium]